MMKIDLQQYNQKKEKNTVEGDKQSVLGKFLNTDIVAFPLRLNDKKKEQFYSELSILFSAGVNIKSALELVEQEQEKAKDKQLFLTIKESVVNGSSLSESIQKTGKFSPYEYFSIKIGEESGRMKEVLKNLSDYYLKKIKQRKQVVNAVSYPAVVLTASFIAMFFMIRFVVPVFADIFKQFNKQLPPLTRFIIKLSEFAANYAGVFLVSIIILSIVLYMQRNKTWYRRITSSIVLKLPIIGPLVKKIYLARFCNSMSILTSAKTPLVNAIELVKQMVQFYPIESSLIQVKEEIIKGISFHQSLEKHPIYNRRMIYLIKVGEEVNQLDIIFEKMSSQYVDDLESQTKLFLSLLEPLMIIILGLIVGTIFISMYLPLFEMSASVN
jgi:type IV pilus assembly protein PilC